MKYLFFLLIAVVLLPSCERVQLNHAGVLMENFGKQGKEDFTIVQGRVSTFSPGTELFQVPLWEQRSGFEKEMHLQASDKTAFTCLPSYSYKVIQERAIDVIFNNKHLGSGNNFLLNMEENVLEPRIYDILKDVSRSYNTEFLMADGGSLKFENTAKELIEKSFTDNGLLLITFTAQLNFSEKVTQKIDSRNEVDQDIATLDKAIVKQRKQNELAKLEAEENLIKASGITPPLLHQQFIQRWDGKSPIYPSNLQFLKQIQ